MQEIKHRSIETEIQKINLAKKLVNIAAEFIVSFLFFFILFEIAIR